MGLPDVTHTSEVARQMQDSLERKQPGEVSMGEGGEAWSWWWWGASMGGWGGGGGGGGQWANHESLECTQLGEVGMPWRRSRGEGAGEKGGDGAGEKEGGCLVSGEQ